MEALLDLLQYLDPVVLIKAVKTSVGLDWVFPILLFIIFAETGLLFGFFLPGDSLLFTAGLFAGTGYIETNIVLMWVGLMAAAIIGDQVGYLTGRRFGKAIYKWKDTWYYKRQYIDQTEAFYQRHGGKTIIIGRFVPIVRTFAPIVAGIVRLEYSKFIPFNVIGGVVWITSMLWAGYLLGDVIEEKMVKYVILGIILVSILPIISTWWQERQAKRKAAPTSQGSNS